MFAGMRLYPLVLFSILLKFHGAGCETLQETLGDVSSTSPLSTASSSKITSTFQTETLLQEVKSILVDEDISISSSLLRNAAVFQEMSGKSPQARPSSMPEESSSRKISDASSAQHISMTAGVTSSSELNNNMPSNSAPPLFPSDTLTTYSDVGPNYLITTTENNAPDGSPSSDSILSPSESSPQQRAERNLESDTMAPTINRYRPVRPPRNIVSKPPSPVVSRTPTGTPAGSPPPTPVGLVRCRQVCRLQGHGALLALSIMCQH